MIKEGRIREAGKRMGKRGNLILLKYLSYEVEINEDEKDREQ